MAEKLKKRKNQQMQEYAKPLYRPFPEFFCVKIFYVITKSISYYVR